MSGNRSRRKRGGSHWKVQGKPHIDIKEVGHGASFVIPKERLYLSISSRSNNTLSWALVSGGAGGVPGMRLIATGGVRLTGVCTV